MIQIRRNTFETNSSSTHAFAYYKEEKPKIDFENYEATIDCYHTDTLTYPIHTFDDLEGKLRYFYTVYCYEANPNEDEWDRNHACKNFMEKIFKIFPKVTWVEPPKDPYKDVLYLEDVNYVFYTGQFSAGDELHHKLVTEDDIKNFLQNGVIFFGDRDCGNPYAAWTPWEEKWDYNKDIIKITSATG